MSFIERPSKFGDAERCIAQVDYNRKSFGRCANGNGKGPGGLYCTSHAFKLLRDTKGPKMDWKIELARFLQELTLLIKDVRVLVGKESAKREGDDN